MRRKILAVLVGFLVAFMIIQIVYILFTSIIFKGRWCNLLIYYLFAALAGGITTGYLARQAGWVYGLIVGVLLGTLAFIVLNLLWWIVYNTPRPVKLTINMIRLIWTDSWEYAYGYVASSTIGGYLGQLYYTIWHK